MTSPVLRNRAFIAFLTAVVAVLASCKTQQPITRILPVVGHKSPQGVLDASESHKLKFETLSFRAATEIKNEGKTQSFKSTVRIQRDSAIWISVSAIAGVEAARMLITPDTLKFLNRLENTYFIGPTTYLDSMVKVEMDFATLQAVLVGNMVPLDGMEKLEKEERKELRDDRKEVRKEGKEDRKVERKEEKEERKELKGQGIKQQREREKREREHRERRERIKVSFDRGRYLVSTFRKARIRKAIVKDKIDLDSEIVFSGWLNAESFKLESLNITDFESGMAMQTEYSNFEAVGNQLLATTLGITLTSDKLVEAAVNYSKIKLNPETKLSFRVPSKFTPMTAPKQPGLGGAQ